MSADRLTTLDASFLEVESERAHMHVGWAAEFAAPRGGRLPTFEQLRDHVGRRLPRAPRYRQKLAQVPFGLGEPVWVDDEDFDLRRHVREAESSDWREVVDGAMSAQLDRRRPLWELWIADDLGAGRIGAVGKVHHCMVDGIAAVELASLLLDPSPEPAGAEPDAWTAAPPPSAARLAAGAVRDRVGDALGLATLPLRLARHPSRVIGIPGTAVEIARAAGHSLAPASSQPVLNEPISPYRHLARARRSLDDLKRVKRRFGVTLNDVVLAASSGGVRRFLEGRSADPIGLKAMVPASVRERGAAGELGNRISFMFVNLPCDEPDPVRRLQAASMAMSERKGGGEPEGADAMLRGFGHAPLAVQHAVSRAVASPRAFNLVVSNIPGPSQPLYMLGCELEEVYPVVPIADRHAVSIGVTTIRDRACFGVYVDRESLPDADLLARYIGESVDELVACC